MTPIRNYINSLGLDAYVVGGAVRDELLGIPHSDEDFLVAGVDQVRLRALLEPHGRVEDLEVHGQLVGVRLFPSDQEIRELAPSGVEIVPPRAERSTGPGHRDFEIISDASIEIEEDMSRRDFTINAMAIRLSDGKLIDPFGGANDLELRWIRTVSPTSFADDPLRIVRGLRFISQLDFAFAPSTLSEMRNAVPGLAHVSAERIGGGLEADGRGELSKMLLGDNPRKAMLFAEDVGARALILPEVPTFYAIAKTVQYAATQHDRLQVRLACLFAGDVDTCRRALTRLRYPIKLRDHVIKIVATQGFIAGRTRVEARRFLAAHGVEVAFDAIHTADAEAQGSPSLVLFADLVREEQSQPHRISDLAITGDDLIQEGFTEGKELGQALKSLLSEVVEKPVLNEKGHLLDRVRLLQRVRSVST